MTETKTWKELIEAGNEFYRKRRYAQAEICFLDALKQAEQAGVESIDLALVLNNIAAIYHTMGKYAMAEEHYKRSLAIKEQQLGTEHLDVALNLYNLAVLYSATRKYDQAEPFYKRALEIREGLWGDQHVDLCSTLKNYAECLRRAERNDEAQLLEDRIEKIRSQVAVPVEWVR